MPRRIACAEYIWDVLAANASKLDVPCQQPCCTRSNRSADKGAAAPVPGNTHVPTRCAPVWAPALQTKLPLHLQREARVYARHRPGNVQAWTEARHDAKEADEQAHWCIMVASRC